MATIIKADKGHSSILGFVHSNAWKEAYRGVFPQNFLEKDTPAVREKEFLADYFKDSIDYYLIFVEEQCAGIMKTKRQTMSEIEITGIYLLSEFQKLGLGTQLINYLKSQQDIQRIVLWVLELNLKARDFYEKSDFVWTGRRRTIFRGKEYIQLLFQWEKLGF